MFLLRPWNNICKTSSSIRHNLAWGVALQGRPGFARRRRWGRLHLPAGVRRTLVGMAACCLLLAAYGCRFPGSVRPTVKVGLSAPFEGLHRDLGYEVLHAVRLAIRQRNEAGGASGTLLIELVALNDLNEPEEAVLQARKMAVDPGILGVLGGWSAATARAAALEYERLGLAFLAPEADWTEAGSSPLASVDPQFAASYQVLSGGAPPGEAAVWAYAATNRLLDAFEAAATAQGGTEGRPTRQDVQKILVTSHEP